jgi:hypothetical protein
MTKRTRKVRKPVSGPDRDAIERFRAKHGDSLRDDVAKRLKKTTTVNDRVDLAALRKLAERNGCWKAAYSHLNVGLARMTIGNKLRALARNGGKVKWGAK